ncbi:MAG: hypothetical protein HQL02_05795 [Nitrospirae bacterium]|nr:hypothetical protein [Nitrospirota bacterium]
MIKVTVDISTKLEESYRRQSIPIPKSIEGYGLIDTGATITAVDIDVIKVLNIAPRGTATVLTPQGSDEQEIFSLRMALPHGITFNFQSVTGSVLKNQGIIALIGRDVLIRGVFVYNGTIGVCSFFI